MQHAMEVNGGRVVQLIGNFEDDAVTQIGNNCGQCFTVCYNHLQIQ